MAQHGTGLRVVVIGGGIAGVSAAWALARHPSAPQVTLIEAEGQLAHHTTGRSAAQLIENYGTPPLRALTRASLPYFLHPPAGVADGPLLERRGVLSVADDARSAEFELQLADGMAVNPTITEIPVAEAVALFPALRPEPISRVLWEPESYAIDVAAVHQSFVRGLRRAGGTIATHHRALRIDRAGSGWRIHTGPGGAAAPDPGPADERTGPVLEADVIVNAAGAWGDDVAHRAGLTPIGLQPLRRTAFMVASRFEGSGAWPLVADIEHRWYVKPDGVQFLCSPADETPSAPCDAKPEELDVARAIDAINAATTIGIRSVASQWAGLRTFTPDRTMAIGPDPAEPTFVWCVGQGGTGIQSSPGAGQLVADLALDGRPGASFDQAALGGLMLDPSAFDPARFLTAGATGPAPAPHPSVSGAGPPSGPMTADHCGDTGPPPAPRRRWAPRWRGRRAGPRRRRQVAIALGLSSVAWIGVTGSLFVWRDDAGRAPAPADAVVVLAGGRAERLDHGLRLAADGRAPVLVISNGADPTWPEANAMCRSDGPIGVPAGVEVLCPRPDPQRTAGEAAMVASLAAERGWQRVVVVTSDFHARRTGLWFERCAAGAYEVTVVGVDSAYNPAQVWALALREQVGLVAALTVQRGCPAKP